MMVAERFSIGWKPEEKDGYANALKALGEKIKPFIEDGAVRYVIIPSRSFDIINWSWIYRLDAVESSQLRVILNNGDTNYGW